MNDCYLLCNIVKCRKELKTQAWVTLCSHIFCLNHGQNAVEKERCLVCDTKFSQKYDIVVMNLNPPESYKTMCLAGLSPEKVLEVANRSLTFWTYQIHQDRLLRDSEVKAAKQHSAEIADYCDTMVGNHKIELQKLFRQIQGYQKEIEEKNKQLEDLSMQLAEKSKLLKNLQSQNDSLKRSLAGNIRSHESYVNYQNDFVEQEINRSVNSNFSYQQNRNDIQNDWHTSDDQNKDFIFKPVTRTTPNFSGNSRYKFN